MKIVFHPENRAYDAIPGENLLKAAEKAGVLIDASCAGAGICGKCKVKILSGRAGDPDPSETGLLSARELEEGYRLACKIQVQDDLMIEIPGLHGGTSRKKSMAKLPEDFVRDVSLRKFHVKVAKATMENQKNDLARIAQTLSVDLTTSYRLLPHIHTALSKKRGDVTATLNGNRLIALEEGDTSACCYGVAFDIGTTTVVGMLWNLADGSLVDVEARTNPQSLYGSDVISRIQFCNDKPENIGIMQSKVVACFNDILQQFYSRNGFPGDYVYDLTVVGNTTMSHLFLGVPPEPLARTPFAPVFCDPADIPAHALGLDVNPNANIHLLPNIAGHVGSDIVGVMLATNISYLEGVNIAIDIGTNGEVVLSAGGKTVACSTAAGPAFEGASIHHGMRAAKGAIEGVEITKDGLKLQIIDDDRPIGICGSGLIDAVAQMLEVGLIDISGRMIDCQEAVVVGFSGEMASRLCTDQTGKYFVLAYRSEGEDIILTQQDIREVQLAKGAMLAGMLTLLKTLGLSVADISQIILAGAFGNYIKKESALRIGLLPQVPIEKIISVGNAAGAGACMALLSCQSRRLAVTLAAQTQHVELSMNMDFQDAYIDAMTFDLARLTGASPEDE